MNHIALRMFKARGLQPPPLRRKEVLISSPLSIDLHSPNTPDLDEPFLTPSSSMAEFFFFGFRLTIFIAHPFDLSQQLFPISPSSPFSLSDA